MLKKLQLLIICFFYLAVKVQAQCTPDPSIIIPGIYPNQATGLPAGRVGIPYNETVQIRVLTDTTFNGLPAKITSIKVVQITNLPPGLSYICNPAGCTFPGGSNGCMQISGVPAMQGTYPADVILNISATVLGVPITQTDTLADYYTIVINGPVGINAYEQQASGLMAITPNPFYDHATLSFKAAYAGTYILKVYSLIGKEVFRLSLKAKAGDNYFNLYGKNFGSGIFICELENGDTVITRRMVVSGK